MSHPAHAPPPAGQGPREDVRGGLAQRRSLLAGGTAARGESLLSACEWALALGASGMLVWIHARNWLLAPMLWRDEISTLHIATRPTLGELWARMEWESSPLLWPLVLRGWADLGFGGTALALRALAFGVGMLVLASLFVALRRTAGTVPLLSLLLVAANPAVIRFGDTLRAYGLALAFAILLVPAMWRLSLRVTRGAAAAAALTCVLAVHCLYHDAVVVFALAVACAASWLVRRRLAQAAAPLAIGAAVAVTLVPYAGPLSRARAWNGIMQAPVDLAWLAGRLRATIDAGGAGLSALWCALVVALLVACARSAGRAAPHSEARAEAAFFSVSLVPGVVAYAAFLLLVGYPTQSWYYFSLLGFAAVLIESGLHRTLAASAAWRVARLAIAAAGFALALPGLWRDGPVRLTNLDAVAQVLRDEARPDDLVLVYPWYLGIAFDHYDAGPAPWLGVPDLPDHALTRYDLLKALMTKPDEARRAADRAQETLDRHGRVWVVGELPLIESNPPAPVLPIAPGSPFGWQEGAYELLWGRDAAHRLQSRANVIARVPLPDLGAVSPFEAPPLYRFEARR